MTALCAKGTSNGRLEGISTCLKDGSERKTRGASLRAYIRHIWAAYRRSLMSVMMVSRPTGRLPGQDGATRREMQTREGQHLQAMAPKSLRGEGLFKYGVWVLVVWRVEDRVEVLVR